MNHSDEIMKLNSADMGNLLGRIFLKLSLFKVRNCFIVGIENNGQVRICFTDDFELKTVHLEDGLFLTPMAPRRDRPSVNEGDLVQLTWDDDFRYNAFVVRRMTVNGRLSAYLYFLFDSSV